MFLKRFLITIVFGIFAPLIIFPFLPGFSYSAQKIIIPLKDDFPLPQKLTLCGEPMPLEDPRVLEMLDRELTIAAWDRAQVFMWIKRSGRYFPYIEKALSRAGMPLDLKYITLAESSLLTHIKSPAGAKGPWQFMIHTARRYGLRKDRYFDERLNFEKATDAALKYLSDLRGMFDSWTLAMAAYNCGEVRIKEAIEEQKIESYYLLGLPIETERYVFRIAAAKVIMEDLNSYGYHLSPERIYRPLDSDRVSINIPRSVRITNLAKEIGTDYKTIKDLNPHIQGRCLPKGRYILKTPPGTGEKVAAYLERKDSVVYCKSSKRSINFYVVKRGDTLIGISLKTGVPVSDLKKLNKIRGSVVFVGQRLRLSP